MKHLPRSWRAVANGYETGPSDEPIKTVLLPGIRGDPLEFIRLAPLLSGRIFIGRYPEGVAPSLPVFANRMQEVLKKGQPVHLIGASFGGLVGWAFDPGLLLSLTTIGSLPEKTASARNSGLLARLVPRLPELPYRILYGLKTARSLQKDGPDLQNLAIPSQDSLARRLTAISRWELSKQPPVSITCIWGQEDEFVRWTESSVRKLGFTPAVVPGGHFPHLSHPDAVCAVLSPEVLK